MDDRREFGLTRRQLETIRRILAPFAASIDRVILFGSRAQGRYRPDSDIDLVLKGNIDERTVDRLWTLFQESGLPFKVDVVVYEHIRTPALKAHIDQAGVTLFTREDLLEEKPEQGKPGFPSAK